MIYLQDKHAVIFTPPHTASGNLHRFFCSPEVKGIWVNGPDPVTKVIDHHYAGINIGWNHKANNQLKKILVVRNPYDRFIGLFLHFNYFRKKFLNKTDSITFMQFCKNRPGHWIYHRSIINHMNIHKTKFNHVVHYEHLEQELEQCLNMKVKLNDRYHEPNIVSDYFCNNNMLQLTKGIIKPDIKHFKYEVMSC